MSNTINKPIEISEGEMNETETMNNNPDEQAIIEYDQYIMEYNAMEEESEINDIMSMGDESK